MVAGVEFKLRGDAATGHQVGHGPGALAYGLQHGVARCAFLVPHREVDALQRHGGLVFTGILQPAGIPHRPRGRQDAREQVGLIGRPHGKQTRHRVTRQQATRGRCIEQPFDLRHHLIGQHGQPQPRTAAEVVVLGHHRLDRPRREFLIPVQSADGHQVKAVAAHLLAGFQQQLPILVIVNRIDQRCSTIQQFIQAHPAVPEMQFLYLHHDKDTTK